MMVKISALALGTAALISAPLLASAGAMHGHGAQAAPGYGQMHPGAGATQPDVDQAQPGAQLEQDQDEVIASQFTATVTGDVSSVDRQSGKLTLDTDDGPVSVRFPPAALENVSTGDRVTVAIGLLETSSPSASPRTEPSGGAGTESDDTAGGTTSR